MKQKKITLPHCELFVVELPEGAKNIRIDTNQSIIPYGKEVNYEVPPTKESYGYEETEGFALPHGNWRHLGAVNDVSEEQVCGFVDKSIYTGLYGYYVKDIPLNTYCYKNALESFNTLLQANEIYFENPLGDKYIPENCPLPEYRQEMTMNQYDTKCIKEREAYYIQWVEAQSKVWDKERTFLFIKVD